MIKRPRLIREFGRKIEAAVEDVAAAYAIGGIADEDDFTSQLLAGFRAELNGWMCGEVVMSADTVGLLTSSDGDEEISFGARKLTSKGRGAEEEEFGADILIAVNINLLDYTARKGILIQAKRLDMGKSINGASWDRLSHQIEKMLRHTSQSYVWLYDSSGVRSVRAETLNGFRAPYLELHTEDVYTTKCGTFLGELIQCKHGDFEIQSSDRAALAALRTLYRAKFASLFSIRDQHD